MEWQLPIQKVEISNINIGSPWARETKKEYAQKPMAPLSYFGTHFRLPFVSLLFPPLPILEYNASSGRLVLDMSETSLASIKLSTFHDTLVNAILYHQYAWFKSEFSKDEIKAGFQPMYQDNHLILHCPSDSVPVFNGKWGSDTDFKPGMRVRVSVKIHGISFLNRAESLRTRTNLLADVPVLDRTKVETQESTWSGRCRLQHRILGIIVQAG